MSLPPIVTETLELPEFSESDDDDKHEDNHMLNESLDLAVASMAFGVDTTSSLPVPAIIEEIKKAMQRENIQFTV
jgi:hypothetical protein